MLDATGKIPDGVLGGNKYALGSYQSCLDIKAKSLNGTPFSGKFGTATFVGFPTEVAGACLPDSCTKRDFKAIFRAFDKNIKPKHLFIFIHKLSTANEQYHLSSVDVVAV